jgi:ribosomal protein L37AE/L43A
MKNKVIREGHSWQDRYTREHTVCPSCNHYTLLYDKDSHIWYCNDCGGEFSCKIDKDKKITFNPLKEQIHRSEKLETTLEDRAKYHSKRQKGLSPFCSMGEGILEILKDDEGENMKLEKLNESNLTEDTVEKLYHSYKDIGKIVRFKGRHGNRWEIVDFIERYYNSYSEFKYKLKDIDMPGGTAVCDCDDVELVPTPKEQPKVEEPKKDASLPRTISMQKAWPQVPCSVSYLPYYFMYTNS